MTAEPPLISCLCVTEGRSAFIPWLLWGFDRQSWSRKELVVVDSSPVPAMAPLGAGGTVRVIAVAPGTNVPCKRNLALAAARGRHLAWFDDDDWQHPDRLRQLALALDRGANVAGSSRSWFVDLQTGKVYRYPGQGGVIFNSAGFASEAVRAIRFDEAMARASDTGWMDAVLGSNAGRVTVIRDAVHTCWLCHDHNLSNPRGRYPLCFPIVLLKQSVGAEAWGDTDDQLAALRRRLLEAPVDR
jgi:glycosyltransferase involved in cell wall biosynthesis